MAINYTSDDLKYWLRADPKFGQEWTFILNKMTMIGCKVAVESLFGRNFDGTDNQAIVSTGAKDRFEAVQWAADAMREWAGLGCSLSKPYFMYIARQWANEGPSRGHTAKCLGSTLDFLTMISRVASRSPSSDMLPGSAAAFVDVTNVFCWVFSDRINATQNKEIIFGAKICGRGFGKDGAPGLNRKFWNTDGDGNLDSDSDEDQTHHFAGFFQFGATYGAGESRLHVALSNTGDWSIIDQKILNKGDYDLAFVAARYGNAYSKAPGFIGKAVEAELT
jgi:hypothetical protein